MGGWGVRDGGGGGAACPAAGHVGQISTVSDQRGR